MKEYSKNISDRIITNYPPEAEVDYLIFSKLTRLTNFDFKIKTHNHFRDHLHILNPSHCTCKTNPVTKILVTAS